MALTAHTHLASFLEDKKGTPQISHSTSPSITDLMSRRPLMNASVCPAPSCLTRRRRELHISVSNPSGVTKFLTHVSVGAARADLTSGTTPTSFTNLESGRRHRGNTGRAAAYSPCRCTSFRGRGIGGRRPQGAVGGEWGDGTCGVLVPYYHGASFVGL